MTAEEKRRFLADLKAAIESSDLTPAAIAKRAGVSKAIISRFLAGRSGLNVATAERIAAAIEHEIVLRKKTRRSS